MDNGRFGISAYVKSSRFVVVGAALAVAVGLYLPIASADSVNSPNITINVDTNRSTGNGAGNAAVTVNTITIAETSLPEYSSAAGKAITLKVRPGFQFDATSNVTAQSATIGFNGGGINVVATITPTGAADEVLTFNLTSGTNASAQDIIRFNGVKLKILSAAGAAGPAQTTMTVTTSTAGGAFTNQGIVAASIQKGAADRLIFSAQPGSTQSGSDLLPQVKIVDFGGNLVSADSRKISLAIQTNPGAATLAGVLEHTTDGGIATWVDADNLNIAIASTGYTLRASHDGAGFLTSDTVDSNAFDISAGAPDHLVYSLQPADTVAGGDILLAVTLLDAVDNIVTATPVNITLDSAVNPGGWPLLADTSLTKATVNGVAEWTTADHLRISAAIAGYRLEASGVGSTIITNQFSINPATANSVRFVQDPTTVQAGAAINPAVTVEIIDAFGNRTTTVAALSLALDSGCSAALTGNTATSAAGLATFSSLSADAGCSVATLSASSGALVQSTSAQFTILAPPPVALRFVQQPTDVEQGAALNPAVSVEIIDANGDRSDSGATIQLTLVSSCGGTLTTAATAAANGLATFANDSIDTACASVKLQATSSGLTAATSNAFEVTAPPPPDAANGATCGACGQGSLVAMIPMLLTLIGLKHRNRRPRHQ